MTHYIYMDQNTSGFPIDEETRKNILVDLGIGEIPQEKQDEIITSLGELILKETFLATMDRLSDEQRQQYDELLSRQASPDEIEDFLKGALPDYEKMVTEIVQKTLDDLKRDPQKEDAQEGSLEE